MEMRNAKTSNKLLDLDKFRDIQNRKHEIENNDVCAKNASIKSIEEAILLMQFAKEQMDNPINVAYTGIDNNKKDIMMNNEVEKLKKEVDLLHVKLDYPIPKISLIYIICSSMASMLFLTTLLLWFLGGYMIIHPFISLISLFSTVGLLITSILSLNSFMKYVRAKGEDGDGGF